MNKLLSLGIILGIFCAASAQAMPVAIIGPAQAELAIPVGSGCGIGVRRGHFDRCTPVYVYDGYYDEFDRGYRHGYYRGYRQGYYEGYRDAYYPYVRYSGDGGVVVVDRGVCGFGSYLRCGYGTCWRLCY